MAIDGESKELHIAQQFPDSSPRRIRMVRRCIGFAACFGPVVLLIVSIVYGVVVKSGVSHSLGFAIVGLLFGILNLLLAFVRPWLYRLRKRSMDSYQLTSGLPGLGTLLVVLAGILGFGEVPTAVVGLVALALDAGGLPWFLIATWHDGSFWDV